MAIGRGRGGEAAGADEAFKRPWHFVLGVAGLEQLPADDRGEIAFAGRSNVGKSSLINALVRQHQLARTSNTPGRTQQLNYFAAELAPVYIVDLPGYGYAAAPKEKVEAWTRLVKDYLRGRRSLARVYLLIDARHGIKPVDDEIMTLLDQSAVSYQVVLTKLDKLKSGEAEAVIGRTRERLADHAAAYPEVIATSALDGAGLDELRAAIETVLESNA